MARKTKKNHRGKARKAIEALRARRKVAKSRPRGAVNSRKLLPTVSIG